MLQCSIFLQYSSFPQRFWGVNRHAVSLKCNKCLLCVVWFQELFRNARIFEVDPQYDASNGFASKANSNSSQSLKPTKVHFRNTNNFNKTKIILDYRVNWNTFLIAENPQIAITEWDVQLNLKSICVNTTLDPVVIVIIISNVA